MTFNKFFILYHLAALDGATIIDDDGEITINGNDLEDIVVSEDGKTSYLKFHGGEIICARVYIHTENELMILFDNRSMIVCNNKLPVTVKHKEFLESKKLSVPRSQFNYSINQL